MAQKLHPITYTRIPICHGISKHIVLSIYTSSTTANKKVNYENLLLPGPGPTRLLAHSITTFTSITHAIKHTQGPKYPTASPRPHYHTLHSPLSITTLPASGESQPRKRVDTITTLPYTIVSSRTANPVKCATRGNIITVGYAETTHTFAHLQPKPTAYQQKVHATRT